jgi:hypothetical protein
MVDHSEVDHDEVWCNANKKRPAAGGSQAFTPYRRARMAEYTRMELRIDRNQEVRMNGELDPGD